MGLDTDQINSIIVGGEMLTSDEASVSKIIMAASALSRNPKLRTALAVGAMAYSTGEFVFKKYKVYQSKRTYMIKVFENDPMYDILQKWLIESLPEENQRNVVAYSLKANKRFGALDSFNHSGTVDVAYDGNRTQEVVIDGHTVQVNVSSGQNGPRRKESGSKKTGELSLSSLQIECRTIGARRAVLSRLREESAKLIVSAPRFRVAQRWGDFSSVSDIPIRSIDSVVLKRGQAERVMEDLKIFLTQEAAYNKLGIPYRRGVLLSGPPGTGKTSLASAISHELGLDVYYIALSAVDNDNTLSELLANVDPRSVLLLEDVDVVHAAKERTDDENGISMAGLLNALDGFVTPHGLITLMTTNHIEVLDPALIRPGRIDIIETIGAVDQDQLERMCLQYIDHIPEGLPTISEDLGIMPASIIEVFKKTIASEDRQAVGRVLVDVLTDVVDHGAPISQSLMIHELMES